MCLCTGVCIPFRGAGPFRVQKRASEHLNLEVQVVVSLLPWVLGLNLGPLQT